MTHFSVFFHKSNYSPFINYWFSRNQEATSQVYLTYWFLYTDRFMRSGVQWFNTSGQWFNTWGKYSVLQSSFPIAVFWLHSIVQKICSRDLQIEKLLFRKTKNWMTLLECYNKNLSSFSFQFTKHYILKELIEISYLDILIGERVAQFFKYLLTK